MRAIVVVAFCLAPVLTASAAEPEVDAVFSQNDVQNISRFIASVTADRIVSLVQYSATNMSPA